jgi:hypothetical protein
MALVITKKITLFLLEMFEPEPHEGTAPVFQKKTAQNFI